jgi:hypothetical protein
MGGAVNVDAVLQQRYCTELQRLFAHPNEENALAVASL